MVVNIFRRSYMLTCHAGRSEGIILQKRTYDFFFF